MSGSAEQTSCPYVIVTWVFGNALCQAYSQGCSTNMLSTLVSTTILSIRLIPMVLPPNYVLSLPVSLPTSLSIPGKMSSGCRDELSTKNSIHQSRFTKSISAHGDIFLKGVNQEIRKKIAS